MVAIESNDIQAATFKGPRKLLCRPAKCMQPPFPSCGRKACPLERQLGHRLIYFRKELLTPVYPLLPVVSPDYTSTPDTRKENSLRPNVCQR